MVPCGSVVGYLGGWARSFVLRTSRGCPRSLALGDRGCRRPQQNGNWSTVVSISGENIYGLGRRCGSIAGQRQLIMSQQNCGYWAFRPAWQVCSCPPVLRLQRMPTQPQPTPAPRDPEKLWCPTCARPVNDPLVCGDCSAVICRVCGTPLESPDELAFG